MLRRRFMHWGLVQDSICFFFNQLFSLSTKALCVHGYQCGNIDASLALRKSNYIQAL